MKFVFVNRSPLLSFLLALILGLGVSLGTLTGLALASEGSSTAPDLIRPPEVEDPGAQLGASPVLTTDFSFVDQITYARIITDLPVSVYRHPHDLARGLAPTRTIEPGFMFVSLEQKEPLTFGHSQWFRINEAEFVPAEVITYYTASTFKGTQLLSQPKRPFGWIIRDTPVFSVPVDAATPRDRLGWPVPRQLAQPGQAFIPRYTQVTIYETSHAGDWGWQRIGPDQWVHLYDLGKIEVKSRPPEIPPGERWIAVNLFDQTLAAYNENDQLIYATLISSGRQVEGWRTPPGIFRIYKKVLAAPMAGGGLSDRYLLEDVTATMYFHEGYAFHAAYWHDDFGRYKSHGCVNMAPADAEWLYNWSTPVASPADKITKARDHNLGTWVWIYDPYAGR